MCHNCSGGFAGSGTGVTGQCQLVAITQLPTGLLASGEAEFLCLTECEEPQEPALLCSTLGVGESSCLFSRLFLLWGAAAQDGVWGKELATSQCPGAYWLLFVPAAPQFSQAGGMLGRLGWGQGQVSLWGTPRLYQFCVRVKLGRSVCPQHSP